MKQTKSGCDGCYWSGSCEFAQPCQYYTPLNGELTDAEIEMLIEREREAFKKQWLEYIGEYE